MPEQPSLEVLVERIGNVQSDVSEIKSSMATRSDQAVTERQLTELAAALAAERAERMAGIEREQTARAAAVREEKRERVEADRAEAAARKELATRVQETEDKAEGRKWWTLTAIISGGVAIVWNIIGSALPTQGGG